MTLIPISVYPEGAAERNDWITSRRSARESLDAYRPSAFFLEEECSSDGQIVPVATICLTNRECPWRCVMCDLWRSTLPNTVLAGAIPAQIEFALSRLGPARQIKLYNSGSFFDLGAIPLEDYERIADLISDFEVITVECHPSLVGHRCVEFSKLLHGRLEVAMGLETAHSDVLRRLNKKMTLEDFADAASILGLAAIDLRTFILVQPPFMRAEESLYWAKRSLDFAFECGATVATFIPTRANNGAMEVLASAGEFSPPTLELMEACLAYGLTLRQGRVFVDLWDTPRLSGCGACTSARISRMQHMNLSQTILEPIACETCRVST